MEKKTQTRKDRIEALEDIKLRGLTWVATPLRRMRRRSSSTRWSTSSCVDQFYEENKDLVTAVIHRACRENYEFFMTLVEQAISHLRETAEG